MQLGFHPWELFEAIANEAALQAFAFSPQVLVIVIQAQCLVLDLREVRLFQPPIPTTPGNTPAPLSASVLCRS